MEPVSQAKKLRRFISRMEALFGQMGISTEPVVFQVITAELFELVLHDTYCSKSTATDDDDEEVILTYKEENAIRYMAGYVVRNLQNKIADKVEMLVETDKKHIEESSSMDVIDRGGLIHMTDDVTSFSWQFSMPTVDN